MSQLESGARNPSILAIKVIWHALEISPADLLGEFTLPATPDADILSNACACGRRNGRADTPKKKGIDS